MWSKKQYTLYIAYTSSNVGYNLSSWTNKYVNQVLKIKLSELFLSVTEQKWSNFKNVFETEEQAIEFQ